MQTICAEVHMAETAPDRTPLPQWTSLLGTRLIDLLGWRLIDARPDEGWIRVGFSGKQEFCNAGGFVQGGILSAMLDGTMSASCNPPPSA
jgi:acyl-coenzyme A thioesterase PaaI-like protein